METSPCSRALFASPLSRGQNGADKAARKRKARRAEGGAAVQPAAGNKAREKQQGAERGAEQRALPHSPPARGFYAYPRADRGNKADERADIAHRGHIPYPGGKQGGGAEQQRRSADRPGCEGAKEDPRKSGRILSGQKNTSRL